MTRDEFEQRKQRLDEQLRAGIELLTAAHGRQVQALNVIRMTDDHGEELAAAPLPLPAPSRAPRRSAGGLYLEVLDALANVSVVFDRNHVCAQLGYEPDRGSLYRVLQELIDEGVIRLESRGGGRTPTRYRKKDPDGREAGL
ncbi:MAG TPA: hypothetical protein VKK31_21925 [Thermoanaerobaculia bacterium]|nr:hypothetical protein [Thermoanaerobaculia bacterium]